jgi:hypothetical protein
MILMNKQVSSIRGKNSIGEKILTVPFGSTKIDGLIGSGNLTQRVKATVTKVM